MESVGWCGMISILEGHRQCPNFLWRDGKKLRIKENECGEKSPYAQELFPEKAMEFIEQPHDNRLFVMPPTLAEVAGVSLNSKCT